MRVITGTARGRALEAPAGLDTRPTAARVKEAVFSIIQFEVEGARVLDLFAGSGQMGIEALSRDARHCVFVDNAARSQEVLRRNLAHTRLGGAAKLVAADALSYLRTAPDGFDIAFVDPPYKKGLLPGVLDALVPLMSAGGAVICETPPDEELPAAVGDYSLHRSYRYGKTKITVYRRPQADEKGV